MDYKGKRWQAKRKHILLRDKWTDQYLLRQGVKREANLVHHILPAQEYPDYQWKDWNLISISETTHKHLHEKYTGRLSPEGWQLAQEVADLHGIKLTTLTLVIGMPGTGKTTWTRQHIKGGLAYDLDIISAAFRLGEEQTSGSRRMAAALRRAFVSEGSRYSGNLFVIRSAPDYDELSEMMPDRIIYCKTTRASRKIDNIKEMKAKIEEAICWAEANGVEVVEIEE